MNRYLRVTVLVLAFAPAPFAAATETEEGKAPRCEGAYADDFTALSPEAREFDRRPEAVFSRCTRNTAIYECLSYSTDGAIRRERKRAVLHGTAFAYKRQGPDTLLMTNEHVAAWPSVTDAQHPVEGIPLGCKKVSETLVLVDDEHDTYARDDVPLTRIVADPQLDVAVLKAHAVLGVMPWKLGHSGSLSERNVVEVRGFPLGAFRATNVGKVISARDHDDFGEWEHDDFVIDALLSAGNSGSPVLAISCRSGEYELVGIYHAGYTAGSALNVVVGIDQVRDLMTTLKRGGHDRLDGVVEIAPAARDTIATGLGALNEMFFPFGSQVAAVRGGPGGALFFALFSKEFPVASEPLMVIEDLTSPLPTAFGELGRVWLGSARGLKLYDHGSLDADALNQVTGTLDALRMDAAGHAALRSVVSLNVTSRQADEQRSRKAKTLARIAASRADQLQTVSDLAERLAPQLDEATTTLAAVATTDQRTLQAPALSPSPLMGSHQGGGAPRTLALSGPLNGAAPSPRPPTAIGPSGSNATLRP